MLKLEIVTPEKRVIDAEVDYVSLPTASGEAGILPNHPPLVTALKPGVVTYSTRSESEKLAISSGFAEVNSDKVSVLVDAAEAAGDVDTDAARADRDAAEKAIAAAGAVEADAATQLRDDLDHATARLDIGSGR